MQKIYDQPEHLFICHECDTLHDVSNVKKGTAANCICCGNTLFNNPSNSIDRPLAFILTSVIFFIIANIYPIMTLNIAGIESDATLTDTAIALFSAGKPLLAIIVWSTSVLIPGFIIFGLLYISLAIRYNLNFRHTHKILVWVSRLLPWGMMDVFFLGILVALVKLVALADILLGAGFYSFIALIFTFAAASASFEPYLLWEVFDKQKNQKAVRHHEK